MIIYAYRNQTYVMQISKDEKNKNKIYKKMIEKEGDNINIQGMGMLTEVFKEMMKKAKCKLFFYFKKSTYINFYKKI